MLWFCSEASQFEKNEGVMKSGLALTLLIIAFASVTHADTIVDVTAVANFNSVFTNLPIETIDLSFDYDATTNLTVAGTVLINATGALGGFTPAVPNNGLTTFFDMEGDGFAIQPGAVGVGPLGDPQAFPNVGSYNLWDLFLNCVAEACYEPLGGGNVWARNPESSLTVSAVTDTSPVATPEPGTLISVCVGLGLLGIVGIRKQKVCFN